MEFLDDEDLGYCIRLYSNGLANASKHWMSGDYKNQDRFTVNMIPIEHVTRVLCGVDWVKYDGHQKLNHSLDIVYILDKKLNLYLDMLPIIQRWHYLQEAKHLQRRVDLIRNHSLTSIKVERGYIYYRDEDGLRKNSSRAFVVFLMCMMRRRRVRFTDIAREYVLKFVQYVDILDAYTFPSNLAYNGEYTHVCRDKSMIMYKDNTNREIFINTEL